MLSELRAKAGKGIRQPHRIPPYVRRQVLGGLAVFPMAYQHQRLSNQTDYVDDLQKEDDWLLIVLDACRFDVFAETYSRYFTADVEPVISAGVNTFEYGRLNWGDGQYDVTYVSAATPIHSEPMDFSSDTVTAGGLVREGDELREHYQGFVPTDHISNIIDVWKTGWDEELGITPPKVVTDRAIAEATSADRVVAHYFQPHAPYIGEEKELGDKHKEATEDHEHVAIDASVYERVANGEITDSRLRELYVSNLERALPEVARLIAETDFDRVAVMGDHGEALSEYGQYFHRKRYNPYVRVVPWAEVRNVHKDKFESRESATVDGAESDAGVQDRLQQLGYIE